MISAVVFVCVQFFHPPTQHFSSSSYLRNYVDIDWQNCTKFDRSRSAGPEIRSNLLEIRLKMFEIRSILVGRLDACAEMCRTSNSSPWAVFREGRDINTSIRFRTENGLWRSWDQSLTLLCLYFIQNRPSRPVPWPCPGLISSNTRLGSRSPTRSWRYLGHPWACPRPISCNTGLGSQFLTLPHFVPISGRNAPSPWPRPGYISSDTGLGAQSRTLPWPHFVQCQPWNPVTHPVLAPHRPIPALVSRPSPCPGFILSNTGLGIQSLTLPHCTKFRPWYQVADPVLAPFHPKLALILPRPNDRNSWSNFLSEILDQISWSIFPDLLPFGSDPCCITVNGYWRILASECIHIYIYIYIYTYIYIFWKKSKLRKKKHFLLI